MTAETRRLTLNAAAGPVTGYLCRVHTPDGTPGLGFGYDPTTAHEMAILDAEARSEGLPLTEILGGEPRTLQSALRLHPEDGPREAQHGLTAGYTTARIPADTPHATAISTLDFDTILLDFPDHPNERTLEEIRAATDAEIIALTPREFDADVPVYVKVRTEDELHALDAADGVALTVQRVGFLDTILLGRKAREQGLKIAILTELESAVSVKAAAHLAGALNAEICDLSGHLPLYEDLESLGYAPELELTGPGREVRVHHDPYELAEAP